MKKLHKKIGAVALASMIVAGGFGASKIDSHAWSLWGSRKSSVVIDHRNNWDLKSFSKIAKDDYDWLINYYLKVERPNSGINIIAVSEDESSMNKYIKQKFGERPELVNRLSRVANSCFYGSSFVDIFNLEQSNLIKQNDHSGIVKIQFGSIYVLASKIVEIK